MSSKFYPDSLKPQMKRKNSDMEYYDVNDTVKMLENIEDRGLPDEYDTFHPEMEELYKTLKQNDNAKELTEIIKELTKKINEEIKNQKFLIKKSKEEGYSTENIQNTIDRYQNNLNTLNNMGDIKKSGILKIYNNPDIPIDDKRNAINGIINGDIVITAKSREINSIANSADKSISTKKKKKGGKKSYKKKSTKKSRTKKARK